MIGPETSRKFCALEDWIQMSSMLSQMNLSLYNLNTSILRIFWRLTLMAMSAFLHCDVRSKPVRCHFRAHLQKEKQTSRIGRSWLRTALHTCFTAYVQQPSPALYQGLNTLKYELNKILLWQTLSYLNLPKTIILGFKKEGWSTLKYLTDTTTKQ